MMMILHLFIFLTVTLTIHFILRKLNVGRALHDVRTLKNQTSPRSRVNSRAPRSHTTQNTGVQMKFSKATLLIVAAACNVSAFTFTHNTTLKKCFVSHGQIDDVLAGSVVTARYPSTSALYAKKKKKKKSPADAALDALENNVALWDEEDEPKKLSKKEMLAQMKGKGKDEDPAPENNAALSWDDDDEPKKLSKKEMRAQLKGKGGVGDDAASPKMSMKERKAAEAAQAEKDAKKLKGQKNAKASALDKLLELEELEAAQAASSDNDNDSSDGPDPYAGMSKKEIKAAKKLEEKKAKKAAERANKKAAAKAEREAAAGEEGVINGDVNGEAATVAAAPPKTEKKATLEERIKKERPPPRVRVMEGVQPGYVSLRLENVAVTFRNQEVLKDVTWGVNTGDRVGLVGANGTCHLFGLYSFF